MSEKIPKEIMDILEAVPVEEEILPPFKMPKNSNLWIDHKCLKKNET